MTTAIFHSTIVPAHALFGGLGGQVETFWEKDGKTDVVNEMRLVHDRNYVPSFPDAAANIVPGGCVDRHDMPHLTCAGQWSPPAFKHLP
jgi:hypothetical protein